MKITFLGTGTSHGVPMIGCDCAICQSESKYNKRLRASIYIETNGPAILIDTSVDFRYQALRSHVRRIDAVLYTHTHADHLNGLDDLRAYNHRRLKNGPIDIYGSPESMKRIQHCFDYIFMETPEGGGKPKVALNPVTSSFQVGNQAIRPLPVLHGTLPIYGYRISNFAYLTDTSFIPDTTYSLLTGVEVLVLGALRDRPHPTHFSLEQALEAANKIGAHYTYFTHIAHDLDHHTVNNRLPQNVALAYDGQVISW